MSFDPNEHMLTLKGKKYLQVAPRLVWVREDHPECTIDTDCTYADDDAGVYRFKATVTFAGADGVAVRATAHGMATRKEFASGPAEKAETKAIGRALAFLGYGTLNAQELDEDETGVLADTPGAPRQPTRRPAGQQRPPQTNDEAEASALETQHRRLYNAAQRDQEGKLMLLAYLKQQGKTRITEMTMAEATEWLLVFHDREVTPDEPVMAARV